MRKNIQGTSLYESVIGFSRAVRLDNHVYVSGTGPAGADDADPATQTRHIFNLIQQALAEAGASLEDVVRTRIYLTRREDWEDVARVHGEIFGQIRPAATMVVVAQLLNPAWRVEIEADAALPQPSASAQASATMVSEEDGPIEKPVMNKPAKK